MQVAMNLALALEMLVADWHVVHFFLFLLVFIRNYVFLFIVVS